jgi:hypothetical protein
MKDETLSLFIRNSRQVRTCGAAAIFLIAATFSVRGESLPDMRPALVGSAPSSIVNIIDTQKLMKSGMQHGAVYFSCWVRPSGSTLYNFIWGETDGADALRQELKLKLQRSYFIPAVWQGHNVYGYFIGTATFNVGTDGKPHVRVYANQEKSELAEGRDFIAPQVIYLPTRKYEWFKFPRGSWATEEKPALVELELKIDAGGQLKDARVIKEDPAGTGLGEYFLKEARQNVFLPAYRNGKPVDSTTHPTLIFIPGNYSWRAKF